MKRILAALLCGFAIGSYAGLSHRPMYTHVVHAASRKTTSHILCHIIWAEQELARWGKEPERRLTSYFMREGHWAAYALGKLGIPIEGPTPQALMGNLLNGYLQLPNASASDIDAMRATPVHPTYQPGDHDGFEDE